MPAKKAFIVHGKIMLAGEYGVIAGGAGLTIPLKKFTASLDFQQNEDLSSPETAFSSASLYSLFGYLEKINPASFHSVYDPSAFRKALKQGAWIRSDIPAGYGAGSSGAVSALVYHHFFTDNESLTLAEQKSDLARIESFFHGKSSGVDALSCYRGVPLHFQPEGEIEEVDLKMDNLPGEYLFFLYDSGIIMETAPLVSWFLEQMEQSYFATPVKYDYLHMVKLFISALLRNKEADPAMLFRAVSDFQYTHFHRMIPEKIRDHWIEGQISNDYYLKLCGSGGGFILGIVYEGLKDSIIERFGSKRLIWL